MNAIWPALAGVVVVWWAWEFFLGAAWRDSGAFERIRDFLTTPLVGDEPTEPLEAELSGGLMDGEHVPHLGFRARLVVEGVEDGVPYRALYFRWNVAGLPRRVNDEGMLIYYAENLTREAAWLDD